jgi:hypothetical protein
MNINWNARSRWTDARRITLGVETIPEWHGNIKMPRA